MRIRLQDCKNCGDRYQYQASGYGAGKDHPELCPKCVAAGTTERQFWIREDNALVFCRGYQEPGKMTRNLDHATILNTDAAIELNKMRKDLDVAIKCIREIAEYMEKIGKL